MISSESYAPRVYVALTHYPVVNKNGETIASAVTNLDVHDISRAARTYGAARFYVVTPLDDQRDMVSRIVAHWTMGAGARYNALRKEALDLIRIEDSLDSVKRHIDESERGVVKTVVTCARHFDQSIGYDRMRTMVRTGEPHLLIFGTAWGLSDECIGKADYILEPIGKNRDYNHLSVRSAVSIILDRLLGEG